MHDLFYSNPTDFTNLIQQIFFNPIDFIILIRLIFKSQSDRFMVFYQIHFRFHLKMLYTKWLCFTFSFTSLQLLLCYLNCLFFITEFTEFSIHSGALCLRVEPFFCYSFLVNAKTIIMCICGKPRIYLII